MGRKNRKARKGLNNLVAPVLREKVRDRNIEWLKELESGAARVACEWKS